MTLAPLLLVTTLGGVGALLAARWTRLGRGGVVVGLVALLVALVVALGLPATEPADREPALLAPFAASLSTTAYVRLVAVLWSLCGLVLAGLAALTGRVPGLAGATLMGLSAGVVGLASSDLLIATTAAIVAGIAGLLVTAPADAAADAEVTQLALEPDGPPQRPAVPQPVRLRRAPGPSVGGAAVTAVAVRELRSVVIAGVIVLGGIVLVAAVAAQPSGSEGGAAGLVQAAPLVGLASLAIAAGVALRTGAIPFHLWAARVADVAPGAALPLLLAWTPLVLAAVGVAAWDARVAPLAIPLEAERAVIIGVAVLTLAAGSLAALVQDDLEHLVGYLAIADSGLVLLALAGADPATVAPSLAWLVILAVSKSALGAWAVAMAARFGSRRLPDLTGWARRAPLLGVAFGLAALGTFGLPGWLAWDIRRTLPLLAAGDVVGTLLWLVALAALVPYARILGAGLDRPTATVAGAPSERPVAVTLPTVPLAGGRAAVGGASTLATAAWRANRPLVVSVLVLALGLLATGVAAGGLGLPDAARVPPPAIGGGESTE